MTWYKAYLALAIASWTAELPDILVSSGYLVGGGVGQRTGCSIYLSHNEHLLPVALAASPLERQKDAHSINWVNAAQTLHTTVGSL